MIEAPILDISIEPGAPLELYEKLVKAVVALTSIGRTVSVLAKPRETPVAAEPVKVREGWGWPANSRKAHYFVAARALCGKWMYAGECDDRSDTLVDNCAECKRRKAKR